MRGGAIGQAPHYSHLEKRTPVSEPKLSKNGGSIAEFLKIEDVESGKAK
jgi:hypothetical protein